MGVSAWQVAIIVLVVLLLFGGKKIPELAKGMGSGIRNFKKALKEDEEEQKDALQTKGVGEKIQDASVKSEITKEKQN